MLVASAMLGTLPGWLTLAALLFGLRVLSRGGAGSAVSELSKANEVLAKRKDELGDEVRDLRTELAELRGRTDFAAALAAALTPLLEWTVGHEKRAQDRHDAMMASTQANTDAVLGVLELVAQRLGPEPADGDGDDGEGRA